MTAYAPELPGPLAWPPAAAGKAGKHENLSQIDSPLDDQTAGQVGQAGGFVLPTPSSHIAMIMTATAPLRIVIMTLVLL